MQDSMALWKEVTAYLIVFRMFHTVTECASNSLTRLQQAQLFTLRELRNILPYYYS